MSSQLLLTLLVSVIPPIFNLAQTSPSQLCPTSVLSRLQHHQVISGESLYGIRADVLFKINGCVQNPTVVYIPESIGKLEKRLGKKTI